MTWFSLACRWWADADVDATGHPWAWPFILEAMKEGNGWAKPAALRDVRLVKCAGLDPFFTPDGDSILVAYLDTGLVERGADGCYTARSWAKWQRDDEAKRERDRKHAANRRESQKVAATSRDVVPNRRESPEVAESRSPTWTETKTTTKQGHSEVEAVITTSHAPARTTPPAPPPAEEQETASSATACELMRQATGTHFLPPLQVHQVGQLVTEFGPAAVEAAIREASASNTRGKPSISFVRAIAARVASGAPKPVPPERTARETGPPRHFGEPGRTVMKEWVDDPAFATEGGT